MVRDSKKSEAAFGRAQKVLVGGVNSPVRSFSAVGGCPPFIDRGAGAKIFDIDGNEYIDYVCGFGPAILGQSPEPVVRAVCEAAGRGTSYGASTELEERLAGMITSAVESIEKVRFTSSGTEAVMTAIRLARGVTGRDKIVKFAGCYHGHGDSLLVQAGSGAATLGVASSAGVTGGAAGDTIITPYNDARSVGKAFERYGGQIAAVLVEPVAGNMGVVPPAEGFLESLRKSCDEHGSLLIFDEVITGFRLSWGGGQERFAVRADITTLGKVIGGGMPVGAVGGPGEIMDRLAPLGPVYQAGTLSGNTAAMSAGLATLDTIAAAGDFYDRLERSAASLEEGLRRSAGRVGLCGTAGVEDKICINRVGSMLCCFFAPPPVENYAAAEASNARAFTAWFHAMLDAGVFLPPSRFETIFISAAHGEDDIRATCTAAERAFAAAANIM